MRDQRRIDRIIGKFGLLWQLNPDMRMAQMLYYVVRHSDYDIYNVEDDRVEEQLDRLLKSLGITVSTK